MHRRSAIDLMLKASGRAGCGGAVKGQSRWCSCEQKCPIGRLDGRDAAENSKTRAGPSAGRMAGWGEKGRVVRWPLACLRAAAVEVRQVVAAAMCRSLPQSVAVESEGYALGVTLISTNGERATVMAKPPPKSVPPKRTPTSK